MFSSLQPNQNFSFLPEEEEQVFDLLNKYVGQDPRWYFKPWRSSRVHPAKSGVYATSHWTHHGEYFGFSYYAADYAMWLQSFDNVESAQRIADSFRADLAANKSNVIPACLSSHQDKVWSEASLAGVQQMPCFSRHPDHGRLRANDDAFSLALLRQAVDPQLKRKTCKAI